MALTDPVSGMHITDPVSVASITIPPDPAAAAARGRYLSYAYPGLVLIGFGMILQAIEPADTLRRARRVASRPNAVPSQD